MMVVTEWRQIFTCAGRHSFFSCTLSVLVLWIQDVESLSQVRVVTWRGTLGTESNIQSCWWMGKDQRIVDPCKNTACEMFKTFNQGYTAAMHQIMTSIIKIVSKITIRMLLEPKNPDQNWVVWGQIFPWAWFGSTWSHLVFVRNNQAWLKLPVVRGAGLATADWAGAMWFQQHSVSNFLRHPG